MAACCSPATPRTSSRRSARAARTAASRTRTTSAWKLALVLGGQAPDALVDSYDAERTSAADENLARLDALDRLHHAEEPPRRAPSATRCSQLAKRHPFARRLVNSGRLSTPAVLAGSPLNTPDRDDDFPVRPGAMLPGAPAADAPVQGDRRAVAAPLSRARIHAARLRPADRRPRSRRWRTATVPVHVVQVGVPAARGAIGVADPEGLVAARYAARPGTAYLLRPDQHVCARWRSFDCRGGARGARPRAGRDRRTDERSS